MKEGYRRGILFSEDVDNLLKTVPKGKITETIEQAITVYLKGDSAKIEGELNELIEERVMLDAEIERITMKLRRIRADEDEKVLMLLKEIGFSRTKKPSIPANELEEVYPYLLRHGIKRTKRQVMEIVEGIE